MRNATLGYVKDFVAAVLACAVLFGVPFSEDQIAGLLLVIVTGGALALAINDRRRHPA
jgi:hypothetical protein